MKVCILLGTRPEIIKCAPIIRECQLQGIPFTLVHSGQHYSYEMDQIFFEELELPAPHYALEVGSASHGKQTGAILEKFEFILMEEKPDVVLVQGDTNTVIAGALAAAKLHIKVGHIEAGLRSYFRHMPEELNRLVADVLSDFLFVPTKNSANILKGEGYPDERIFVTGNTVVDATIEHLEQANKKSNILKKLNLKPGSYFIITSHRPENVDNPKRLKSILDAVNEVSNKYKKTVVWPIHPRTQKMIEEFGYTPILNKIHNIKVIKPIGYFDMLSLQKNAKLVLTDSGGMQEEACILGTPCVTLRDNTERPESVEVGANKVAGVKKKKIILAMEEMMHKKGDWENPFGDGKTAKKILKVIKKHFNKEANQDT